MGSSRQQKQWAEASRSSGQKPAEAVASRSSTEQKPAVAVGGKDESL
ncbi:hypothetical protein G8C92_04485 [Paenibacillus donghaensis]|nr:hypothetical protein [Paenibacillus donghaensis]MBE9913299.1 hypothetical protein [Paenibacillus donghaensis]